MTQTRPRGLRASHNTADFVGLCRNGRSGRRLRAHSRRRCMNNAVPNRLAANVLKYDLCVMLMRRSFSDAIQPAGIGKVYHPGRPKSN